MADSSSESSITIDAAPSAIMAVIADFDSYPAWAGVKTAEVLTVGADDLPEQVRLTIDQAPVKDDYVLSYVWNGDSGVSWHLVKGKLQKAQHGSYELTAAGAATEVRYQLSVDANIPMIGMIKRKVERVIMDTALKGLKKRVESLGG